jgi:hypothetical protein
MPKHRIESTRLATLKGYRKKLPQYPLEHQGTLKVIIKSLSEMSDAEYAVKSAIHQAIYCLNELRDKKHSLKEVCSEIGNFPLHYAISKEQARFNRYLLKIARAENKSRREVATEDNDE